MRRGLLRVTLALGALTAATSYSSGYTSCNNAPSHGTSSTFNDLTLYLALPAAPSTPLTTYTAGLTYAVVVAGNGGSPGNFKGLVLWASSGSVVPADGTTQAACGGARVTHVNSQSKTSVRGTWTAPTGAGTVVFSAAVVREYTSYTALTASVEVAVASQSPTQTPTPSLGSTPSRSPSPTATPSVAASSSSGFAFTAALSPALTLSWTLTSTALVARLSSSVPGGWGSMALNAAARTMAGGDAIVVQPGAPAGSIVSQVYLTSASGAGVNSVASPTISGVVYSVTSSVSSSGRRLAATGWTASFSRPLAAGTYPNAQSISASSPILVTTAWGSAGASTMGGHGANTNTVSVNFATGAVAAVAPSAVGQLRIAHGALMALSFGALLPLGAGVARWGKAAKAASGALAPWFRAHRAIQGGAVVLVAAGLVCAIVAVGLAGGAHVVSAHSRVGLALAVFALAQPLNALVRPHPAAPGEDKSPPRDAWEALHKGFGWAALVLVAPAAIVTGLALYGAHAWVVSAYYVTLALGLAAGATLLVRERARSSPASASVPLELVATACPTALDGKLVRG